MAGLYDSGDDDDIEKFHVTNADLMNEFDPDRPQFKQTKEDALYGIWADRDKSGYSALAAKRKAKYQGPVSFVSGGVSQTGNDKPSGDGNNNESFNNSATKLDGSKSANYSLATKGKKEKIDSNFAEFERYTKGIGSKILQKYGYKVGKGLGKGGQGIVNPIEAHKRSRKVGLGAAGTERTKQSFIHFPVEDSGEIEEEEEENVGNQWRKEDNLSAKKTKYKFRTIDDLRQSGPSARKSTSSVPSVANKAGRGIDRITSVSISHANVKVIDMTRKEKKVFSGYHALAGRGVRLSADESETDEEREGPGDEQSFSCPELLHNIQTLIEDTEQRIISNDRQKQYESDRLVALNQEQETLQKVLDKESIEIQRMEAVLRVVNQCEDLVGLDETCRTKLDGLAEAMEEFQEKHFSEYRMFELQDLAIVLVQPQLQKYFDEWKPLEQPKFGLREMERWKKLLQLDNSSFSLQQREEKTDVYQHIMWNVWMPKIRSAVVFWNPHQPSELLSLLETWMPITPGWIFQSVLTELVAAQLHLAVEKWNPLTDAIPLHSWVHPWLPHMHDLLEPLYHTIRGKLASALDQWDPRDSSALIILEPWFRVFARGNWDAFMIKTIIPKLSKLMQAFVVDPSNQDVQDFKSLLSWQNLLPHQSLVTILDKYFFPKWLRALGLWLNGNADFDEIRKWYVGWKSMFPPKLMENPFIIDRFRRAHDMMGRAITGQQSKSNDYDQHESSPTPLTRGSAQVLSFETQVRNIKDIVQEKAEKRGILFLPINRNSDGQALYQFGEGTIISIKKDVIFRKIGDSYVPVSVDELFG